MVINRYEIKQLSFPLDGVYNYDVQRWTSVDGGKTFSHCGFGTYCRTEAEARAYKMEMEAQEPDAIRKEPEPADKRDGEYYYMDCMNSFVNGGVIPAADFTSQQEAVQMAANYEATLYKLTYKDGRQTAATVIYEPQFL